MYNSLQLANSIKSSAKSKGVSIGELLKSCELSINTMSNLNHGKSIAFDSLAKIADYLGVSVDYLLGRTNNPNIDYSNGITSNNNSGNIITASHINGNNSNNINTGNVGNNSNVNTTTANHNTLDETAEQVAKIFQQLDFTDKVKVMSLLAELTEKNKTA